jgi:hypothetical protein
LQSIFVGSLDNALQLLLANPRFGRRIDSSFRNFVLRRFPFNVVYRYDAVHGLLRISSVHHQRRRPGYWRNGVEESVSIYVTEQLAA